MSDLKCDHLSVGIIAENESHGILLIQRAKPPFGWAPPSGHCDGDSYPVACHKEFEQETGLRVKYATAPKPLLVMESCKHLKCRREGGDYHFWQIFKVQWEGEIKVNPEEVKAIGWYSPYRIKKLMRMTEDYLAHLKRVEDIRLPAVKISIEQAWQSNPGLEPVWYEFFKEVPELVELLEPKK